LALVAAIATAQLPLQSISLLDLLEYFDLVVDEWIYLPRHYKQA
jgi:hypothetical protein